MARPKTVKAPREKKPVGRPRIQNELLDVNLQVRVTKKVADICKSLGGASFLRPLLQTAAAHAEAFKKLRPTKPTQGNAVKAKFIDMSAACGFSFPTLNYAEKELSLNEYFVLHEDSTFIIEAKDDSMIDAGIFEGDILIIDRSVKPGSDDIVLAFLNGEFTLKTLKFTDNAPELHPQNSSGVHPVIRPTEYDEFSIEGVLVGSGRKYR